MKIFSPIIITFICTLSGYAQVNSIMHDSIIREYLVHLPPTYTPTSNMPLVIALHGGSSNMYDAQNWFEFDEVGDTAGFITVYPQSWFAAGWNANLGWQVDDFGFISTLIDTLLNDYSINSDMIYVAGFSSGGSMALYLGCRLDNKITAIASVGAKISSTTAGSCNSGKFVSLLYMHGTGDQLNPYYLFPITVDSLIKFWVRLNNCPSTPLINNLPDTNISDNSFMITEYYGPGQNNSGVMLYKGINMGHQWPGHWWPSAPIYGNHNLDIEASVEIWNFFKKHLLTSTSPPLLLADFNVTVYPNPMVDKSTLRFDNPNKKSFTLKLFNRHGQLLRTLTNIKTGKIEIERRNLMSGLHFFQLSTEKQVWATGKLAIE